MQVITNFEITVVKSKLSQLFTINDGNEVFRKDFKVVHHFTSPPASVLLAVVASG
ncbi:hypothetical protein SDC9_183679 [bioreactor metagenome]|uniref:Uncharacterized protein n=1 Tax=bioreactor metagenome TaxID=1076179 RepID=A0A645HCS9_9ZZZZ